MDEKGKILIIHTCNDCYYCKRINSRPACYYTVCGRFIDDVSTIPPWCQLSNNENNSD